MSTRYTPEPAQIDYHADVQTQRVEAARRLIDPGEVISIVESRLSQEADPQAHPLYGLVNFLLDRQVAVDGAQLYNDWRRRILAAIDTALDDLLQMED
jgi:hypothetical protein